MKQVIFSWWSNQQVTPLFRREFFGYFRSPVAYVFIIIFLTASVGCTFFIGGFYENNQANLYAFFGYLPWLYLILVPAIGMRLWAEERRSGTIELLFTLPLTLAEAVIAKFLAAWAFIALSLSLTFPLWITVNYLGQPDNGVIFTGYLGSLLMAGSYLAITCLCSALTKNQVISFILSILICLILVLLGWGIFTNFLAPYLPARAIDFIAALGFVSHFEGVSRGLVDSRDLLYFVSIIAVALSFNATILKVKKAG